MVERLKAELASRANSIFEHYAKWRDDPVGFIRDGLLQHAWSKQREIAESVRDNRRTAVQACHDVGKDWIAAQICAWWESCFPRGENFLVSIAPTAHQVRAILWREIHKAHTIGGLPGELNQTEWWHGNELVGFGRSPADTDPTAIQGIHARRLLFVVDEAGGVSKALGEAGDSLIANEDSRALAIGNPDDPTTWFAEICKPGSGWNVIRISAFESPNFTSEPIPENIRPLLVSKIWVEEKRKSWGEDSMLWSSKVLGEFPEQAADSLIPLSALRASHARYLAITKKEGPAELLASVASFASVTEPNDLGVDVARQGDDKSVIYRRKGWVATKEHEHKKRDTMELVGQILRCCRRDKPKRIKIDDTGMGGGVTDRLREMQAAESPVSPGEIEAKALLDGVQIIPINVGEGASTDRADERFKNKRAELNWNMRVLLTEDPARIAIEPNDDLDAQVTQVKYKPLSTGEIQIEKKADMKKRTKGVSPDDWDALVLAFAEPDFAGAGLMEYYRRQIAAQEAAAKAAGKSPLAAKPELSTGGVRLAVPKGISSVYGMTGRVYQVNDGEIVADPEDATPLLGQGFTKLETAR